MINIHVLSKDEMILSLSHSLLVSVPLFGGGDLSQTKVEGPLEELLSYNEYSKKALSFTDLIPPKEKKNVSESIERIIAGKGLKGIIPDIFLLQRGGEPLCFRCSFQKNDKELILLLNLVDSYYRKENELNRKLKQLELLLLSINEGIWDWDLKTNKYLFSGHWEKILGYSHEEILTIQNLKILIHKEDWERVDHILMKHLEGETPIYECRYRLRKSDGSFLWVHDRGIRDLDEDGTPVRMIGSCRNIDNEKESLDRLEKMIITDELTGLFNRRHYNKILKDEILRTQRYGGGLVVIMIDIDLFKQVNDTYGHHAGDLALEELATMMNREKRGTDSAYRIGGEEFIIIAPGTDLEKGLKLAERLRISVSKTEIKTPYGSFNFTISLGISEYREGDNPEILADRVDMALYRSKDLGRNRSTVAPS